jgi:hypothetical protein
MELPPERLAPNIVAPGHTRDDYDFAMVYHERDWLGDKIYPGHHVMAPMRIGEIRDDWGNVLVPGKVWCKRHATWEEELS